MQAIDAASMQVLATVGVKVDYAIARRIFAQTGAEVDEERQLIRLPEWLVRQAVGRAPGQFQLFGANCRFSVRLGGGQPTISIPGSP